MVVVELYGLPYDDVTFVSFDRESALFRALNAVCWMQADVQTDETVHLRAQEWTLGMSSSAKVRDAPGFGMAVDLCVSAGQG
jgi:hypothetical protein